MKKYFSLALLLMLVFALAGCGAVKVGQNQATEKGTITLTVKPNGSIKDGVSSQLVPVEATNLRVRIFNSSGQNIVEDAVIPSDGSPVSLQVSLPVGTYSIHAISYKTSNNWDAIVLTGGSTDGVVVQSGQNTQATISLSRWGGTITAPTEPIQGGSNYELTLTLNDHHAFSYSLFYLLVSQTAWTDKPTYGGVDYKSLSSSKQVKYTQTAPSVSEPNTVYYQVKGYLNDERYWREGLPCRNMYLFFPSTTAGESLGTITVRPPDGGVIIGIE